MSIKEKEKLKDPVSNASPGEGKIYVSVRVVILTCIFLIIAALNQYFSYITSMIPEFDWGLYLPATGGFAVFLFAFIVLHKGMEIFNKRIALSKTEVLVLYLLLLAGGTGVAQSSLSTFHYAGLVYFYGRRPDVLAPFMDRYSRLISVNDVDAFTLMSYGEAAVPWKVWLPPIITWTIFSAIIFYAGLCLAVLFRRRWMDQEHLLFPLNLHVVSMVQTGESSEAIEGFWKNRLMWLGFGIAALYTFFGGSTIGGQYSKYATAFWPGAPGFDVRFLGNRINEILSSSGYAYILFGEMASASLQPVWVGLGFMINLDLLFSTWFFFFLRYPFNIYLASTGWRGGANFGYPRQLGIGATIAIGIWQLWMVRGQIKRIWAKDDGNVDENKEWMSLRGAFRGFVVSLGLLIIFFLAFLQVSLVHTLLYLMIFFLAMIGLARMRSEAGLGCQAGIGDRFVIYHMGPGLGSKMLPTNDLAGLTFLTMVGDQARAIGSMGTGLESMKFFEERKDPNGGRKLLWALVAMFAFGMLAESIVAVYYGYRDGLATWGTRPNYFANGWNAVISSATGRYTRPQTNLMAALLAGGGIALVLSYLRTKFVWWPLHPLGIVGANTQMGWTFPIPFFVAWLIKFFTMRYGGNRLVNHLKPFFQGMIIGQLTLQAVCTILLTIVK
jgi:hypothetical protein